MKPEELLTLHTIEEPISTEEEPSHRCHFYFHGNGSYTIKENGARVYSGHCTICHKRLTKTKN